jgi:hypothetical protein
MNRTHLSACIAAGLTVNQAQAIARREIKQEDDAKAAAAALPEGLLDRDDILCLIYGIELL